MGKQKDFRHVHHISHKKKDKKIDKTSRTSCQENFLKNVEVVVQAELESAATAKKIGRKLRKELDRYPLLAKAAFLGCERVVDSILEAGENVNVQLPDGSTPLILAVENGYPGIVQKLLKKGADFKLIRQDGRNALMIAVAKNDNRSFTLIWNYWDKNSFWELNHTDSKGYTLLTLAVELANVQFTNFLLSLNGIELDKQTLEGKTALMFAVSGGQVNVVQKLLENGSDFTLEDKDGATAICLAISRNQREIKELFYERLDSKSRDAYVKKRIELLTRPRTEDISSVTSFYKDVLFRVLLEIRRHFQDSTVLLEKHKIFFSLYKCLDTHSQDTELLRIGFHLTACLMYDKAEYSRYIAEELAEQYVSSKFVDFTLKIMQHHRLKSMTEIRGAASLCIHAGTQCRSGKTWLKRNFLQIFPFVKEFKVILGTLTYWADGENTKAGIMYDRFVEIFNLIERDFKVIGSNSPEAKNGNQNPDTEPKCSENGSAINMEDDWQIVSKNSLKKDPKPVVNQAVTSGAIKKDNRKKNKKSKLKAKLQNKIVVKKLAQRPNLKLTPELGRFFPNIPSGGSITNSCYADALKKNLKKEEILSQSPLKEKISLYKDSCAFLEDNKVWSKGKIYSLSEVELDYDIKRKDKENTNNYHDNEKYKNLYLKETNTARKKEEEIEENLHDSWNAAYCNMYLFEQNENNKQITTENSKKEITGPVITLSDIPANDGHVKQSKAFRDILAALGLKTDSQQDEAFASKSKTDYDTENSKKISNRETKLNWEFLYSDCLKHAPDNVSKYEDSMKLIRTNVNHVSKKIYTKVTQKKTDMTNNKNNEMGVDEEYNNIKTKVEKFQSTLGDAQEKTKQINDIVVSSNKNSPRPKSKIVANIFKDLEPSASINDDSNKKSDSNNLILSQKRKYPEIYFTDFSLDICKEAIKEAKEENLVRFYCTLACGLHLNKYSKAYNKMEHFPKIIRNGNKTLILNFIKGKSNKIESDFRLNFNASGMLFSNVEHQNTTSSTIKKNLNMLSSIYHDIKNDRNMENYFQTPIKDVLPPIYPEERDIVLKTGNKFDLDGNFSKCDTNICKFKRKSCKSRKQLALPFSAQIESMIMLSMMQKITLFCKSLVFNQVMYQAHLSTSYLNNHPCIPKQIILNPAQKDIVSVRKYEENHNHYHYDNKKLKLNTETFALNEEYKMLKTFNHEIGKIISYIFSKSEKGSKFLYKKVPNNLNSFGKIKQSNGNFTNFKERKSSYASFTFCNDTYGYKPYFINCELRSRWYEILHRIESCIPLGAFFLEYGETVNTESSFHEITSATGNIVYSSKEEHILRQGDFGTFVGLMNNGNPVVVKIFQKTARHSLELLFRKRHLNHKNIVLFYCLCNFPNDQRVFAVTELLEYSLPEYMKTKMIQFDKKHLIYDLIEAIQYLHGKRIVHGFLKPSNIMITVDDRLKVSDFYQIGVVPVACGIVCKHNKNKASAIGSSAISDFSWRPYEIIAATMKTDAQILLTKASDIQMTGMLIYYILSEGKHPFGSSDLQCQKNIRAGSPEFGPRPSDIESRDLIRDMIKSMPSQRPKIQQVAKHPYLWNIVRRFEFLVDVARKIEFFTWRPTKIAEALQDNCIEARDWIFNIHPDILNFLSKWMQKTYENNFADLLHFILSMNDNFEIMPKELKLYMANPSYFISKTYPTFFMSVYCVLRQNIFVQQQMGLQEYF